MKFEIVNEIAAGGRTGRLSTAHGDVPTPTFMPVGTYGAVRGLMPADLAAAGTRIVLANAYHLALRPGAETISKLGGLHRFMGWDGAILTDSGGYQIFSLASRVKVDEEGATFRSHLDGSKFQMTPERAVSIQHQLGVDIGMAFDVLTGRPGDRGEAARASERTLRWAKRTRDAVMRSDGAEDTAIFAILQGGLFEDLRASNASALIDMDFPGHAVGGLSVGEGRAETMETARYSVAMLPADKPRYMMGMGTPSDLVALCQWGYDLFDCVIPTRNGRNGSVFTRGGAISIRNAAYALDDRAIEADCTCYCCRTFSRAYLHHLAKRGEMLAAILASLHNVAFYQRLMADIRRAIEEDRYDEFRTEFEVRYGGTTQ